MRNGVFPSKEQIGKVLLDLPPDKNLKIISFRRLYIGYISCYSDSIRDFPTIGEWYIHIRGG